MDISSFIKNDPWMMEILRHVQTLNLPDWWIGAGFVRNKVWDELHGYKVRTPLNDIDVVYFDEKNVEENEEKRIEKALKHLMSDLPWSVKNQARMAIVRGDGPYKNAEDGLSRWIETATCIGVRLNETGSLRLTTPLGTYDLTHLILKPNPKALISSKVFSERIKEKNWLTLWPKLKIVD